MNLLKNVFVNLGKTAKRIMRLSEARRYFVDAYRRRVFDKALREFVAEPWATMHSESDVLVRLMNGWGNTDWSASDEYLLATMDEFSRTDGPLLECGSGLSTIILGVLASTAGREVWTLEHSAEWAAKVSRVLEELEIDSVHLRVRPLKDYGTFSWYDPPLESMPRNFSLVVCDGPPGSSHGGRSGMLSIMRDYLTKYVSILLDDTIRHEEREIARFWAASLGTTVENCGVDNPFATIRVIPSKLDHLNRGGEAGADITIGIPTFDNEHTIGQSIDSILAQSYRNLRLLISDNDSSDNTKSECLERVRRDLRVHYYRQKNNIGVFRNYNGLFMKCKSKYFKWQSSSDWCDDDLIGSSITVLESNPDVVLVYAGVFLVDKKGGLTEYSRDFGLEMADPSERFVYLLENIQLCNMFNGVIRTSALRSTKLNAPFLGSDIVLLAELALGGKIIFLPDRKWYRRMTPETASKLQSAEQRAAFFFGVPRKFDKHVTWKLVLALFVAVFRSDNDLKVRLKCLRYLLRKILWIRGSLYRELFQ